jgi:aryl-alcohol dehydrogenase-like predicted oxidoreductase
MRYKLLGPSGLRVSEICLGTMSDYLDVLWVHAWDYATPVDEVMHGLDALVRAGKSTTSLSPTRPHGWRRRPTRWRRCAAGARLSPCSCNTA